MTLDAVIDQQDGWFNAPLESERYGIDQLRAADALLLGHKTYEGLSAYWPTASADPAGFKWGDGVRPLRSGTSNLRMRLISTTAFSSGVVLAAYEPLRAQDG